MYQFFPAPRSGAARRWSKGSPWTRAAQKRAGCGRPYQRTSRAETKLPERLCRARSADQIGGTSAGARASGAGRAALPVLRSELGLLVARSRTLPDCVLGKNAQSLTYNVNGAGNHNHTLASRQRSRTLQCRADCIFLQNFGLRVRSKPCYLLRRGRAWVFRMRRDHTLGQREQNAGDLTNGLVAHGAEDERQRSVL